MAISRLLLVLPLVLVSACKEEQAPARDRAAVAPAMSVSRPVAQDARGIAPMKAMEVARPANLAAASFVPEPAPVPAPEAPATGEWLAYQHHVEIRTTDVGRAFTRTRDACLTTRGCRLISANHYSGDMPNAHLTMRMPRDVLVSLRNIAEATGSVLSSGTTARDHSPEVADIQTRRAMLSSHRDRLLEIQLRADKVEDLMRVAQELARVQAEIERLDGRFRMVEDETSTDLLNVTFTTPVTGGRWYAPIVNSIQGMPHEFAVSLGAAIAFAAFALPWVVPLSLALWAGRVIVRRLRRRKSVVAQP